MPCEQRVINTKRSLIAIALFVSCAFLLSAGCATILPQTNTLQKIHDTYRADFQKSIALTIPTPADEPVLGKAGVDQAYFADTLREIRDYRVTYGEKSQEAAHLKVLEGMIYLQTGQTGMARLLAPDVRNAEGALASKTGAYVRDQLLARVFYSLVDGWDQIGQKSPDAQKLQLAADHIGIELKTLDPQKISAPEVDEGAVYIATTAAIFYVWAYRQNSFACEDTVRFPNKRDCDDNLKKQTISRGRDLIELFLSDTEKKAAEAASTDVPPGRLRYISWYRWLQKFLIAS
jgi:hypothetical protein